MRTLRIVVITAVVIVAAAWPSVVAPALAATTFDGGYTGAYHGDLSSAKVGGEVAYTVTNGAIAVTSPVDGSGSVSGNGDARFGGTLQGLGYACTFTGRFVRQDSLVAATGDWTCGDDGSGTWSARRTTAPTSTTTVKPASPGSATATRGTITIRRANGKVDRGRSLTIRRGDAVTTGPRDVVRLDLPGVGRVDLGQNSSLTMRADGALVGIKGAVTLSLPENTATALTVSSAAGPTGKLTVAFSDGSKVLLGPSSSFTLGQNRRTDLSIDGLLGTLKATVSKLAHRRFEVRTPTAVAGTRGTVFTVTSTADTTTVETTEGVVNLRALASGASVDVPAGYRSTIRGTGRPSTPVRVRP